MQHLILALFTFNLITADSSDSSSSSDVRPGGSFFRRSSDSSSTTTRGSKSTGTGGRDDSWSTYGGGGDDSLSLGSAAVDFLGGGLQDLILYPTATARAANRAAENERNRLEIGGHTYIKNGFLGEGQYGAVFAAIREDTQEKVAIKEMSVTEQASVASVRTPPRNRFDFAAGSTAFSPIRHSPRRFDNSFDDSSIESFQSFRSPSRSNFRGTDTDSSTVASQNARELIDNEVQIMRTLQNEPDVVRYIASEIIGDKIYLVMEYCSEGDLGAYISKHGPMQGDAFLAVFNGLKGALKSLHRYGIIHRDIKPDNLLIHRNPTTRALTVKLADFGLAARVQDRTRINAEAGSTDYMAPERLKHQDYDDTSDIWSAGLTAYEVLTKQSPRDLFRPENKPTATTMETYDEYITRFFETHQGVHYPTTDINQSDISPMVSISSETRAQWLARS